MTLRLGGESDTTAVLGLFDANVGWLAARGRDGQWGSTAWSPDPSKRRFVRELLARGEVWLDERDGRPAGCLVVGTTAPDYTRPADEPELYVHLLIADPALRGAGVGSALLAHAADRARERRIALVRVDCWAGGDGRLVAYYEGQGFTRTTTFDSDGWIGQVLERRLS